MTNYFDFKVKLTHILSILFVILFVGITLVFNAKRPLIFVLQSYNMDYSWTRDVNNSIKKVLGTQSYFAVRWHFMDTKNHPSPEYISKASIIAQRTIDEYEPDVLIAIDDDAQAYVAKHYINHPKIKIIFAGVNAKMERYGYDKAENVTGILERIPLDGLKDTLQILHTMDHKNQSIKVMHISDNSSTVKADDEYIHSYTEWNPVKVFPSMLVSTFDEWKKAILNPPAGVNYFLISNYRKIYDEDGKLMRPQEIMEWTLKNSPIPIIGVNGFIVEDGGYIAVATSPFEQGEVAATMALKILRDKKDIKEIPVEKTKQFIIYMRENEKQKFPSIYEAFARAANKYWDRDQKQSPN